MKELFAQIIELSRKASHSQVRKGPSSKSNSQLRREPFRTSFFFSSGVADREPFRTSVHNWSIMARAIPAEKCGGYSLQTAVRNFPNSSFPIAVCCGYFAKGSIQAYMERCSLGSLRPRSPVGFRTTAPHRHWSNSWSCMSG